MISEAEDLHAYSVQRLFVALRDNIDPVRFVLLLFTLHSMLFQQPLCQVGVWSIGEYGDLLVRGDVEEEEPIEVHIHAHSFNMPLSTVCRYQRRESCLY